MSTKKHLAAFASCLSIVLAPLAFGCAAPSGEDDVGNGESAIERDDDGCAVASGVKSQTAFDAALAGAKARQSGAVCSSDSAYRGTILANAKQSRASCSAKFGKAIQRADAAPLREVLGDMLDWDILTRDVVVSSREGNEPAPSFKWRGLADSLRRGKVFVVPGPGAISELHRLSFDGDKVEYQDLEKQVASGRITPDGDPWIGTWRVGAVRPDGTVEIFLKDLANRSTGGKLWNGEKLYELRILTSEVHDDVGITYGKGTIVLKRIDGQKLYVTAPDECSA